MKLVPSLCVSALLVACRATPPEWIRDPKPRKVSVADSLWAAVQRNDAPKIESLLTRDSSNSSLLRERRKWRGGTVLHEAVRGNWLLVAETLLQHGASPSAPDKYGDTPLHLVRCPEMVELLLSVGADVHAANDQGVLVGAVDLDLGPRMMRRVAESLAAAGASEDLRTAVMCRPAADVLRILADGAELDTCLLHHAARRGDTSVVRALLAAGCTVTDDCGGRWGNIPEFGDNPLTTAVQHGNYDAAAALLAAGAPVRGNAWPSSRHGSPAGSLLARAAQEAPLSFVAALIAAGAKPDKFAHRPAHEHSALARAAGHGRDDVVQLLLRAGAKVSQTSHGITPLLNAAVMGNQSTLDILIRNGAEPTLLAMSAAGRAESVRALLKAGAIGIDAPDAFSGKTPLMWAIALGHDEVARVLLAAGAAPNACGLESSWNKENWYSCVHMTTWEDYMCPVGQALASGHTDLLGLLVAKGAALTKDDLARLAGIPGSDAETLITRCMDKNLRRGEWLALLRGTLSESLKPQGRSRRFDRILGRGVRQHRSFAGTTGSFEKVEGRHAAPYLSRLRSFGWRPSLVTACRFGLLEDVQALAPACPKKGLWPAALAALTGDQPAALRILRSLSAGRWNDKAMETSQDWAKRAAYRGGRAVLADLLARREVDAVAGLTVLLDAAAGNGHAGIVADLLEIGDSAAAVRTALNGVGRERLDLEWFGTGYETVMRRLLDAATPSDVANGWLLNEMVRTAVWRTWAYDHANAGTRREVRERVNHPTWIACARMLLDAGADPRMGETLDLIESWAGRREATPEFRALADECRRRALQPATTGSRR